MPCNAPKCQEARKLAEQRAAEEAQRKVAARSCTEITEEFLTSFIDVYLQIREGNLLVQLGLDSGYVNNQISLLSNFLIDIKDHPGSCASKSYHAAWTKDKESFLTYIN